MPRDDKSAGADLTNLAAKGKLWSSHDSQFVLDDRLRDLGVMAIHVARLR